MRNKPAVYADTFGGDLANALLLRPVYRKPTPQTPPPEPAKKTALSVAEMARIMAEHGPQADVDYDTGRVEGFWCAAKDCSATAYIPQGKTYDDMLAEWARHQAEKLAEEMA